MTKLEKLTKTFEDGMKRGADYFFVKVKLPNLDLEELIVNPFPNAQSKLDYYKSAYTDDLKLKANNDIEITLYGWHLDGSDTLNELYENR